MQEYEHQQKLYNISLYFPLLSISIFLYFILPLISFSAEFLRQLLARFPHSIFQPSRWFYQVSKIDSFFRLVLLAESLKYDEFPQFRCKFSFCFAFILVCFSHRFRFAALEHMPFFKRILEIVSISFSISYHLLSSYWEMFVVQH